MTSSKSKKLTDMEIINASKVLPIEAQTQEEARREIAKSAASAEVAAARAIQATEGKNGIGACLDTPELIKCLRDQAAAVNSGDLSQAEAMLMNQATTLQSLFARLTERGMGHDAIPGFESNMRMALRAQSQCRATLETLAAIKNPPIIYARQANVTTGPQQINNNTAASSQAREIESEQSKLSGDGNELLPDTRASSLAGRVNQEMEAVGEINWAEVRKG